VFQSARLPTTSGVPIQNILIVKLDLGGFSDILALYMNILMLGWTPIPPWSHATKTTTIFSSNNDEDLDVAMDTLSDGNSDNGSGDSRGFFNASTSSSSSEGHSSNTNCILEIGIEYAD
jgi:hypothetical protein